MVGCVAASVVAGAIVEVCAAGYLPGEQVQAFLHSTPRFLAVLTADAEGRVAGVVTIPADVEPGAHRVELRGVTTGRSLLSATFSVTATRRAAPTALAQTGPPAFPTLPILAGSLLVAGVALTGTARRLARRASP